MIGLVILAYSRTLVNALGDLVSQVTGTYITMTLAPNERPERDEFGTDADIQVRYLISRDGLVSAKS